MTLWEWVFSAIGDMTQTKNVLILKKS